MLIFDTCVLMNSSLSRRVPLNAYEAISVTSSGIVRLATSPVYSTIRDEESSILSHKSPGTV